MKILRKQLYSKKRFPNSLLTWEHNGRAAVFTTSGICYYRT
ncbi:hypothetical protein LEP1GSC185_0043 [Leptospira licerasiae serovar Varillal str. VAR 010]|uniref:Uncharacterized protein n=1 Tax=Leptospira licerasiae str. MMD4847 TaxID=1049971 RepID=A0ABN0H9P1_9LEPT|nr:hypothetical protein LEP1GSC185_0043 [Leptospira licerasiae serovar Varillal str. VAR 010]EJZ42233.1 hypothetical protein LEP1GSC178_2400 [Leptospira licerasiae str. MMD4847]